MFFYSNENIQSNAKVKKRIDKKNNRKQINKPSSGTLTLKKEIIQPNITSLLYLVHQRVTYRQHCTKFLLLLTHLFKMLKFIEEAPPPIC